MRLAGLPWDENRYKTDQEYNKALGRAYFAEMLRLTAGSLPHAYASYNAGYARVKSAMRKAEATGGNWLEQLPEETKNYVAKNMRAFSSGKGGGSRPTLQELDEALRADPRIAGDTEAYDVGRKNLEHRFKLETEAIKQREDEAMSEANAFMQSGAEELRSETERVLAGNQAVQAFSKSIAVVRNEIKDKLDATGRFSPKNNAAYASLHSSFFATQAQRHGVTPEEMYRRYEPTIQAEGGGGYGQALASQPPKGWTHVTDMAAAAGLWNGSDASQAVFWTDLQGKLAHDAPGLAGYSHSVDRSAINHIRKNHGDVQSEAERGQIAITDADLARIPEIVTRYDDVRQGLVGENKEKQIAFVKAVDDGVLVYVAGISDGRQNLRAVSMWKYPPSTDAQQILKTAVSGPNAQNERGHAGIIDQRAQADQDEQHQRAQQGWLDGQPYNLPTEALTTQQEQLIVDTFNENAGENENFELTFGGEEATYFQRSQETKAAYEARIDELFAGAEARKFGGVRVLDRSDMLDMLGYGDMPLNLAEGKVKAGIDNHPLITADVWKKVPEWIENPAMVFDSDTESGRLVFVAPEKVKGRDVRIIIAPNDVAQEASVLVNAYDSTNTPYLRWAYDGLMHYADTKKAPGIDERFGRRLPDILKNPALKANAQIHSMGRRNDKALRLGKILTENNLSGYRKSHASLSQGDQEARGAFNPDTLTITLLKKADLSTFLHETGHFFLEVTADMASREDAPEGVRQDMNTLLNWFGVGSLAEWNGMDIEARRAHHEKFARGFEAYLYEGNPPSVEMQGVFQRFRQWLIRVYKDLRNLNVELTDEVRGVFDRMLATDEEIALAERARNLMPLFETAEQGGMTAEAFAAYQASGAEGSAQAVEELQARRLRDMKWLRNAHGRELKRLQKEVAGLRAEMRESVAAEVAAMPIYRAMRWLKTGEIEIETSGERDVLGRFLPSESRQDKHILKTEKGHKLLIAALREMYPPGALVPVDIEPLIKNQMAGHEGLSPDLIADMFGFSSGDELVRTLLETPPAEQAIEDMTDERMLDRYGDLATQKGIKEAADRAIHNEAHARLVTTEANALARMTGGKKILDSAAKMYAAAVVARTRVRDLLPGKYTRAEAKAAKAAEKAFKAGDIATAAAEKRNQVINQRAAREALAAQDEVRKIEARFRDIAAANQKRGGNGRNIDLVNAAQAILAEYGVGVRGKNPRQYMDAVKSYDPELFAALEPLLQDAEQNARPIADLTVGELRALRDDIDSLWHMARRERMVEIDGKMIDRQEVTRQLADRLEELGVPKEVPGEKKAVTEREKMVRYLMGARAGLRRVESWADRMDGGNITGPFRRFVFQPISEAADRYRADSAAYLKRYRDLLNAISPSLKPGRIEAKEIGYTFGFSKGDAGKAELLHAILHTGNESNKRKLLLGNRAHGKVLRRLVIRRESEYKLCMGLPS